ncbi:MAG: hypothetical protein AAFU49_05510, partial [Pseudomonadota bacterium]
SMAVISPAFSGSVTLAQSISASATFRKKTLATRLDWLNERLLTEIAAMPLKGLDHVEPETITTHIDEIGEILVVLREGSKEYQLGVERNVGIQFLLDDLRGIWGPYETLSRQVVQAGAAAEADMETLERHNEAFEAMAADLVDKIYEVYSAKAMSVETARSLKILSHAITRTQMMKKYIVLAVVGFHTDEELAKLKEAASIFGLQMRALIKDNANYGMAPPPTPAAEAALKQVEASWSALEPVIAELDAGAVRDRATLDRYWTESETINESLYAALEEFEGS